MRKVLFLVFSISTLFGEKPYCPNWCGNYESAAASQLIDALEKMEFVSKTPTYAPDDVITSPGYTRLRGYDWEIGWMGGKVYRETIDEDDEWYYTYSYAFGRYKSLDKNPNDGDDEEEWDLYDFSETRKILNHMYADICFIHTQKTSRSEKIIKKEKKKLLKTLSNPEKEKQIKNAIHVEEKRIDRYNLEYQKRLEIYQQTQTEVLSTYQNIFDKCVKNHGWLGAYYQRGMTYFEEGDFIRAINDIDHYIQQGKELNAQVYQQKGHLESILGKYDDAILSLSKAIGQNPENKEVFFERAIAYFETGDFTQALEDYLESGHQSTNFDSKDIALFSFSTGIIKGITSGGVHSLENFVPSMLCSLQGLGNGIWAFALDPKEVSLEMLAHIKI